MGYPARDEWEYRTLRPPRESTMQESKDPTDARNDLGAAGWELADTIDYVGGGTKLLVLKRPAATGRGRDEGPDDGEERRSGTEPDEDQEPTADSDE